ncbi:MAG: gamma-glutamyl-gamma-aminobutyrate hydrolase family protein [Bacteroidales bacterium]|nr:gamma-glutamyl-gamma-aminobutyrate hydrolase family protein [Bacteroidales bacterium]
MLLLALVAGASLLACSRNLSPVVGVSCSRSGSGSTLLPTTYTDALSSAGAVPLVIPTVRTEAEAQAVVAALDGIVFSGGEDVDPAWYGEEVWNETVEVDAVRDSSDVLLARAALAAGKPVLAICRGSQLLNVVLGGSLFQDIPSQLPSNIGHSGTVHKIGLSGESFLSRIYGPDSLLVNSFHHQAVKNPAPGITVIARSSDGIVEAWETDHIWAVQFHPEKLLRSGDSRWLALFHEFIASI